MRRLRSTTWRAFAGALVVAALVLPAGAGAPGRRADSARLAALLESAERARATRDLVAAERGFAEALGLAERFGPRTLHAARAADGLADVYRLNGHAERAVPLYLRSIPVWQSLLGPTQPRLAVSLHNLGLAYLEVGQPDAARPVLEQALGIWTAVYGVDSVEAQNTARALDQAARASQRTVTGTR